MIAQLKGKLAEAALTEIVLDVQGVGYDVAVPLSTADRLPAIGSEVLLYTHLQVREDAMQLYGFASKEERALFRLLIGSVPGVGPRLALNVLSCMSVEGLCGAVKNKDLKAIGKINGIGKKTAERMVVELGDKLEQLFPGAGFTLAAAAGGPGEKKHTMEEQDAINALETLGYKRELACRTVERIAESADGKGITAENLIRKALALMNS